MKACLQLQPELCSRENLLNYFKRQQNEKSTQNCLCNCQEILFFKTIQVHHKCFTYASYCLLHICTHKYPCTAYTVYLSLVNTNISSNTTFTLISIFEQMCSGPMNLIYFTVEAESLCSYFYWSRVTV